MNVYLIGTESRAYKIGYTRGNVIDRLRQLQTGHHETLRVIAVAPVKHAPQVERSMHRAHGSKQLNGEWFSLTESDVESFVSDCSRIDNSITFLQEAGNTFV